MLPWAALLCWGPQEPHLAQASLPAPAHRRRVTGAQPPACGLAGRISPPIFVTWSGLDEASLPRGPSRSPESHPCLPVPGPSVWRSKEVALFLKMIFKLKNPLGVQGTR